MAKTSSWTFVTPAYIAGKRFKGIKTASQVKNFATKNHVTCGWWKKASSSSSRSFLIEFGSFQKAFKTIAKSSTGTKKSSGKSTSWNKSRKSSKTSHSSRNWASRFTSRKAA